LIILLYLFLKDEKFDDRNRLWDFPEVVSVTYPAIAVFFMLKGLLEHIEYRWENYEPSWKKLPLRLKKAIMVCREVIDTCYDMAFALSRVVLGIKVGVAFNGALRAILLGQEDSSEQCSPQTVWEKINRFDNFNISLILVPPLTASYMIMQRIPTHIPTYDRRFIHGIKRSIQAFVRGGWVGGALLALLIALYFLVSSNLNSCNFSNNSILFLITLIAALGGVTTAFNTWVNYQERDSKKLIVVDDEVQALRQALLGERYTARPYGTVELEETLSNNRISKPIANKSKTREVCSWLTFWRSSDRKDNANQQTILISDTSEPEQLGTTGKEQDYFSKN
jgi:hypothetical protein